MRAAALAVPVVVLAVVVAVLASCSATPAAMRIPDQAADSPELPAANATLGRANLIVIAHGTDSSAEAWPAALERAIRAEYGPLEHWDVLVVDWKSVADRRLTAARRGYRLGLDYAASIDAATQNGAPRIVHLIAHSMGAHLIQGIADGLSRASPATPYFVHMTFLDAFHPRGLATARWGIRVFGRNADFAESYLTRDEPAFLTNAILRRAFTFDLTATVPPRENPSSGYAHNWPPAWYLQSVDDPMGPGFALSPLALLGDRVPSTERARRLFDTLSESLPAGAARALSPRGPSRATGPARGGRSRS